MTTVRRTLRAAASGAVIMLVLAGCRPEGETDNPDGPREKVDLDGLEANATPSADAGTPAAPAAAADKAKGLPKTRDRDPEEEKKKLALSHQRSAEAQKHLEAGRLVEAIDHSRQALRIHEQNVEAMLVMAEAYYRQKKFELVQAVTSSALAVDEKVRTPKESSRAHNLKGFAYTAMGQDNLATQAFRKAAEADDKNAAAWNNLGTRYMQAGDIATAKQCFAYALELDPRFAKAHLNFGAALRAEGKWQDAEKSFDTALKLRPNYPEAYFDLGVLYLDADPYPGLETIGRLEKAIAFLTKYRELAIADGPEGPSPTSSKGRGPKVAPGPAPVSKARAEDYIRVAKKGIEREQRRIDREKARGEKKPEAAGGGGTDATPAGGDAPTPAKPGGAAKPAAPGDTPTQPGAGDPGTPPAQSPPTSKPTPSKPGGGAAPTPSKPGASSPTPSEPAPKDPPPGPQKPGGAAPSDPAPKSPTPVQPTPTQPTPKSPTPVQPAPTQPAPKSPTPVQPAKPTPPPGGAAPTPPPPSPPTAKPSAPTSPPAAPQKPTVQKPGGVAMRPPMPSSDDAQVHLRCDVPRAGNPLPCAYTHRLGADVSGAPVFVASSQPRAHPPSFALAHAMAIDAFDHLSWTRPSAAPSRERMSPTPIARDKKDDRA